MDQPRKVASNLRPEFEIGIAEIGRARREHDCFPRRAMLDFDGDAKCVQGARSPCDGAFARERE